MWHVWLEMLGKDCPDLNNYSAKEDEWCNLVAGSSSLFFRVYRWLIKKARQEILQ